MGAAEVLSSSPDSSAQNMGKTVVRRYGSNAVYRASKVLETCSSRFFDTYYHTSI